MTRFADLFIAACIAAVSIAATVMLRFQIGFGWDSALIGGVGLMLGLMILQLQTGRTRDRDRLTADVASLQTRLEALGQDLANVERRLTGVEQGQGRRQVQELESVVAEMEVIGALVRQVVETVADLEIKVHAAPAPAPRPAPEPARPAAPAKAAAADEGVLPKRFAHLGEDGFLELVKRSIEANRIDIHLQPIVVLPQRRIRYYEALTRLRTEDGETIYPSDYIPLAEKAGIMPALDNQILFRTVQILRRLVTRAKDIGVFCNISVASLADTAFFRDFASFLEANRALADQLVFEFAQRQVRTMGPIEYEALHALQETGFRFSVDQVFDLKPSFQLMAERGFRFAKISADRMLTRMDELGTDIHPADLSSFFARFGIELIVDHIETEAQVVDLLDFGVRYGQGFVFSPPRPVRGEVQQAAAETAGEAKPAENPRPAPARPAARLEPAARPAAAASAERTAPEPARATASAEPRRNAIGRAIAQRV